MLFESKKRKTSYVGAYYDYKNDAVIIWERDEAGNRYVVPYHAPYYFYIPDSDGEYTSIFGDKLKKLTFGNRNEFRDACDSFREKFESDISPLYRVMADEYYESTIPNINYAFLDIEVDYSSSLGFSSPENPYAEINAITVYQSWTKKYVTIGLLPKKLRKKFDQKKFNKYVATISKAQGLFNSPDVIIARDESELLDLFVDSIENADIISGWNSEFFDLPYIIKRMEKVRGKLVQRMCFSGCQPPKEKTIERFGTPHIAYTLSGRTHLDYLDLFKKFTFEGRTSYSLGAITGDELDSPKLEHEGSLEQLFNGSFYPQVDEHRLSNVDKLRTDILENLTMRRSIVAEELRKRSKETFFDPDLKNLTTAELEALFEELDVEVMHCSFAMFMCYNSHDVGCLVGLDEKFKFIALVNQMAHENTCRFEDLLGTVRYVESGITNRARYVHQKVVMDKRVMTDGEKVEGALVLTPFSGLHRWLGSVDIASLYPSVIRSLCISPDRYIGQFTCGEQDWRGIKDGDDNLHTLTDDTGETVTMTGAEWRDCCKENKWVLSAYGTVFDQSQGAGIVDETLTYWFAERKRLKKEMTAWKKKEKELLKQAGIHLTDDENELYDKDKDSFFELKGKVARGELFRYGPMFLEKDLHEQVVHAIKMHDHFDLLQLTKKIQLNSCYGALLSQYFRFGRKEMGASVTASGRQITTFMIQQIGKILSGRDVTVTKKVVVEKDGTVKNSYTTDNEYIVYSDTDSCYFVTGADNKLDAVRIADDTAERVNAMFPEFMRTAFFCTEGFDTLISAGREVVGSAGLFLEAKKKYTIRVVNLDGFDLETPKLKTMGSETKRSDTPKVIQVFLKDLVNMILDDKPYPEVEKFVNSQRGKLIRGIKNPISLGVTKQINNLDAKYAEWTRTEKVGGKMSSALPGHVRAAINYNEMAQLFAKNESTLLKSGDKGMVFYLGKNEYGLATMAFPADMTTFPAWFTENFTLDKKMTESKMIDSKITNTFNVLGWDVPTPQKTMVKKLLQF